MFKNKCGPKNVSIFLQLIRHKSVDVTNDAKNILLNVLSYEPKKCCTYKTVRVKDLQKLNFAK